MRNWDKMRESGDEDYWIEREGETRTRRKKWEMNEMTEWAEWKRKERMGEIVLYLYLTHTLKEDERNLKRIEREGERRANTEK